MALKLKNSQTQNRPLPEISVPIATPKPTEDTRLTQALFAIANLQNRLDALLAKPEPTVRSTNTVATIQRDKEGKMSSILITERN